MKREFTVVIDTETRQITIKTPQGQSVDADGILMLIGSDPPNVLEWGDYRTIARAFWNMVADPRFNTLMAHIKQANQKQADPEEVLSRWEDKKAVCH